MAEQQLPDCLIFWYTKPLCSCHIEDGIAFGLMRVMSHSDKYNNAKTESLLWSFLMLQPSIRRSMIEVFKYQLYYYSIIRMRTAYIGMRSDQFHCNQSVIEYE